MRWDNGLDAWRAETRWHPWFAWHPVGIGGQTAWLEKVARVRVDSDLETRLMMLSYPSYQPYFYRYAAIEDLAERQATDDSIAEYRKSRQDEQPMGSTP